MAEPVERGLVKYESRDGQQITLTFDVVRRNLVSGRGELVTEQEMLLYMGMCKARGLNPFKRDCYLVKYTEADPAATIVSIDYVRSRARAQDDCAGWKTGIIVQRQDGQLEHREGSLVLNGETLLGGWFQAKPKNWDEPYFWSVNVAPFVKTTRDGKATRFWSVENQPFMIAKVAESQGLRRLWPDEFQGLFVDDEIIDATATSSAPYQLPQATQQRQAEEKQPGKSEQPKQEMKSSPDEPKGKPSAQVQKMDKRQALEWIDGLNDPANFPLAKELGPYIKGLKEADQEEICRAFNMKRAAVCG